MIQYGNKTDENALKENIIKRDNLQKQAGYYKIYENTISIDVSDCKNVEESTKKVLKFIKY